MTEEKTYKEIAEEIKNILFTELEKQGDNVEIDHDNVRVKILNDNAVYNIYLTVILNHSIVYRVTLNILIEY